MQWGIWLFMDPFFFYSGQLSPERFGIAGGLEYYCEMARRRIQAGAGNKLQNRAKQSENEKSRDQNSE
jgi:hypothetical protein